MGDTFVRHGLKRRQSLKFDKVHTKSKSGNNNRKSAIGRELNRKGDTTWSQPHLSKTVLKERLLVVLCDNFVVGVSPLSGEMLHFTYPSVKMGSQTSQVRLHTAGGGRYQATLATGALVGVDCTADPGEIDYVMNTYHGHRVSQCCRCCRCCRRCRSCRSCQCCQFGWYDAEAASKEQDFK